MPRATRTATFTPTRARPAARRARTAAARPARTGWHGGRRRRRGQRPGRRHGRRGGTAGAGTAGARRHGGRGHAAAVRRARARRATRRHGGRGHGGRRRHGGRGHGGRGGGTAGAGTAGDGGGTAGAGGSPDAGSDGSAGAPPPPACYTTSFVKPIDQGQLSAADDKDGDQCVNGFQYDVVIDTAAPNGTVVELFSGAMLLGSVQASGGTATFSSAVLSSGANNLSIQYPSTAACTDASTKAKVTVNCAIPTCTISKPIISGAHPDLNGVSTLSGGDRASANGSPYEVSFEVTTDVADNQIVSLDIDNIVTPGAVATVTAHASGGTATFAGVPLPADGTYEVQARCTDGNGVVGRSAKGQYPVDTLAPDLTVSKPASGQFIGPAGLTAGKFPVCGSTTATDAVNLSAALGTRAANYCVSTTGSPTCTPATTVGADTCINVACPGDAPFSITVTISDAAGNPTTTVLSGVTCSSTTPTVQIISPVTDAPTYTDPTRHLLANSATQPFKDQSAATPGAQTDVVACTSRAGTAALFAGLHAGTLTQVGASVSTSAATALDGCPTGLGFVVKFTGATLPQSAEDATTGALATATEIRVDVTDASASMGSGTEDLWVDSTAPNISIQSPTGICGSFHQAFATYNTDVAYTTDTPNVTMTILNGSTTDTLSSPVFAGGLATFSGVTFAVGQDNLAAVASDAAGNQTAVQPVPCTVTVGMAPVVIFTTPTSSNELCASTGSSANCIDDTDPVSGGWQGPISVQALVGGVPLTTGNITFTVGGAPLGAGTAALNGAGVATLPTVTLLDGDVTITAQTDNIPGQGVGTGTVTVVVDLGAPNAPTGLTASVLDRRQTSFQLNWTAPSDLGGGPIKGYEVRYARVPITSANFDDSTVTTAVTYTGTPAVPGAPDGIAVAGLNIETEYYFAVAAVDAAGNRSTIVGTTVATRANFNVTILSGVGTDNSGYDQQRIGRLRGRWDECIQERRAVRPDRWRAAATARLRLLRNCERLLHDAFDYDHWVVHGLRTVGLECGRHRRRRPRRHRGRFVTERFGRQGLHF